MKFFAVAIVILLNAFSAHADETKFESVVNACIDSNSRDKICEILVELKQVGDDGIEMIKNYIDLTPKEYAMLTVANVLAQGRLRIRTKSFLIPDGNHIYDIRKDRVFFIIEKSF